ncbi:MAG: hypothetical protein ACOX8K_08400 [Lachnospiraceae bacterium]|jgi:hypothetical protein
MGEIGDVALGISISAGFYFGGIAGITVILENIRKLEGLRFVEVV